MNTSKKFDKYYLKQKQELHCITFYIISLNCVCLLKLMTKNLLFFGLLLHSLYMTMHALFSRFLRKLKFHSAESFVIILLVLSCVSLRCLFYIIYTFFNLLLPLFLHTLCRKKWEEDS